MLNGHSFYSISIQDILQQHPPLMQLMIQFKMKCVGCSMARFCTLGDASQLYQLERTNFRHAVINQLDKAFQTSSMN